MTAQAMRRVGAPVAVLLAAAGLLAGALFLAAGRSIAPGEAPLRVLPAGALAVNFTDWSSLRHRFAHPLSEGRIRDLTTRSVVAGSADVLQQTMSIDVTRLDWEVAGTIPGGSVLALGLGGQDADVIDRAMRRSGFATGSDGLVVDDSTLARLGVGELRVLRHVSLRDGQLLAATSPEAFARLLAVHRGHAARLGSVRAMRQEIAALMPAQSLYVAPRADACADADPTGQGPEAAGQVKVALARAGRLATFQWAGRSLRDDGRELTIAMQFGAAGTAAEQARVRAKLAVGPFIGRSGRVEDELVLRAARHEDATTVLEFARAADGSNVVMSAVGPMLFAACGNLDDS